MTKPFDAVEDFIGRFGPDKRLRILVGVSDVGHDRVLERVGTAMRAALELLAGQLAEPAFDHVDPRGARRREVHMKAEALGQPSTNRRALVGAVVVENQVGIELRGNAAVDLIELFRELLRPMPRFTAPDDLAGLRIQGCEEGHRDMAHVIVRAPLDLAGLYRQQRLRPVQRLDLRLIIDAQHERAVGGDRGTSRPYRGPYR